MVKSDRGQAVAHTGFGQQMPGFGRVALDLGPQLPHVQTQIVGVLSKFVPPDIGQQLPVCDHTPSTANQPRQQIEFGRGLVQGFALSLIHI